MRKATLYIGIIAVFLAVAMTASAQQTNPGTQALQQQMLANPEVMAMVLALQNDPDFVEVLQDPELMKAVNSGDLNALMASPKFLRLLNKQAVHDIGGKLQK